MRRIHISVIITVTTTSLLTSITVPDLYGSLSTCQAHRLTEASGKERRGWGWKGVTSAVFEMNIAECSQIGVECQSFYFWYSVCLKCFIFFCFLVKRKQKQ